LEERIRKDSGETNSRTEPPSNPLPQDSISLLEIEALALGKTGKSECYKQEQRKQQYF
jgi:hypothetical protein